AADSAVSGALVLQFFRPACGIRATQADNSAQLKALLEPFLGHQKATLAWPESIPADLPAGWGKLLMNMAALAGEALPLGGRVEVAVLQADGRWQLRCRAAGSDAGLRPEVAAALAPGATLDSLTPRNVLGYYLAG